MTIGQAADLLGVSTQTLRRWERQGKSLGSQRTEGGQRRYEIAKILSYTRAGRPVSAGTVAYARVSSHDQREDLRRQEEMLEMYCASHGWSYEVIRDLGSGMNYHKQGLRELLRRILQREISRIVLTHKDRLLRFGAELVFELCELHDIEVVLIDQGTESSFETELAEDVLEIMTVFSAKLYGSRSHKNQKLREALEQVPSYVSRH